MTNDDRKIREKLQQKTWNEIKTNDSWAIFKIMAEFVEGYEKLSKITREYHFIHFNIDQKVEEYAKFFIACQN